jgi:hypothetical protein
MRTFASLMEFSQSALFFYLSFHFVILYLLLSVCYPHLMYPFQLSRTFPLCPTLLRPQLRFPNCKLFYGDSLSACRPAPNMEGQSTVFITTGAGWLSYTPRHWVPILVASYDLVGLQWDYSIPRSPYGELRDNITRKYMLQQWFKGYNFQKFPFIHYCTTLISVCTWLHSIT